MRLTNRRADPDAPTHAISPCNEESQGEFLVRNEVGDMVKQLHELRRRLAAMDNDIAQEAIEAVVKACFELDEFLRSSGSPPGDTSHCPST